MMYWVLYHIYTDLEIAIRQLQEHEWIPLIVATPGGLIHNVGHRIELTTDPLQMSGLLPYPDLARGMIQMGTEGEEWVGKYVGVRTNGGEKVGGNPLMLARYLLPNLLAMVCPTLWWLGKDYWPN